jgi:hypothetical protein
MSERSSNAPRSLPRTPGRRAERRLAAAEAALVAGDITGADALAGQAALNLTPARTRRVHGLCLQTQGRTAEAVRTLIDAALEMGTADLAATPCSACRVGSPAPVSPGACIVGGFP